MIKRGYNDPTKSNSWKVLKTVGNAEVWIKQDRFHGAYEASDTTTL